MAHARHLHVEARLDDVVHGAVQMAVLGLARSDSTSLRGLEDIRLALDEVLLDTAILESPPIELDLDSSTVRVVVDVTIHVPGLPVPTEVLSTLVDDVRVVRTAGATRVRLLRTW